MRSILSQVNDGLVQNKIWSKIQQNVKNNPVAETLYCWRFFQTCAQHAEKTSLEENLDFLLLALPFYQPAT